MNWGWGWDAVAAIAQAAEALIVVFGLVLICRQLQHIKREQKQSDWEAVRWALSLFSERDIYRFNETLMIHGKPQGEEDMRLLTDLAYNLELVGRAMQDGYLKPDLYFLARPDIALINNETFRENADPEFLALVDLNLGPNTPAGFIIRLAREWRQARDREENKDQ